MPQYFEEDEEDNKNSGLQFHVELDQICEDEGSGGTYRLKNMPGQLNRQHVMQRGTQLRLQCELLGVIHGTVYPGGPEAALLVLQFQFHGADGGTDGRRFREASVSLNFAAGDDKVGGCYDPEVLAIAPQGTFGLGNLSTRAPSITTVALGGALSTSMEHIGSPSTRGSIAMSVHHTTQRPERMGQQKVYGMKWIDGRNSGPQNAAKWVMKENAVTKGGICPTLKVAALVSPQTSGNFRASIAVDAKADLKYSIEAKTARVFGQHAVDPVILNNREDLLSCEVFEVDKCNLGKCDLMRFSSLPESSRIA